MDGRTAEALVMGVACDIVAVLRLTSRTCLVVAYRPRLRTCGKKCSVQLEMGPISRLQLWCCGLGRCALGCGRRRCRVEAVSIREDIAATVRQILSCCSVRYEILHHVSYSTEEQCQRTQGID